MKYIFYKPVQHPVFIATLDGEGVGPKFIVYQSSSGVLVGDENFTYKDGEDVIRWLGLDGEENERAILGKFDDENQIISSDYAN